MIKKKLEQQENMAFTGQPTINTVSKQLNRSFDAMLDWHKEKERKAEEKRQLQQKQKQSEHGTHSPKINPISDKLAKAMRRNPDIATHLLQQNEKKRANFEKAVQEMLQEQIPASPTISPHSANLQRDTNIYDRLYSIHVDNQEKKKRTEQENSEQVDVDSETGQKLHSPFINARSAALIRAKPIEDVLQEKGAVSAKKKKQAEMQHEDDIRNQNSTSKMGPYSQLLIGLMVQFNY